MNLKDISQYIDRNSNSIDWRYSTDGENSEWITCPGKNYYSLGRRETDDRVYWDVRTSTKFGDFEYGSLFRFSYFKMDDPINEGEYIEQALDSITNSMRVYCTCGTALTLTKLISMAAAKAGFIASGDSEDET